MHWWDYSGYGWMGWPGPIPMLVFSILAIAGLVLLIRWVIAQTRSPGGRRDLREDDPLAILQRRYARGEISRDQYEEMSRDLL